MTFYEALGVDPGASDERIVRAFRERAKAVHPDVSEGQDARDRFKRLKTARDVLTDEAERARYDRLGHASYLRQSGSCAGWEVPPTGRDAGGSSRGRPSSDRTSSCSDGERSSSRASGSGRSAASRAARAYADGGGGREDVTGNGSARAGTGETATAYYRPGHRVNPVSNGGGLRALAGRLGSLGAWILLDVVLVLSALATAGLILSWGSLSPVSVVAAVGLVVVVIATTTLHLSVRTYA